MNAQRATRPKPKLDWFIPIDGDGHQIGTRHAERPPTFEYLKKVAQTADSNGYYSLLVPTRFANGLFEESEPLAETWTTVCALCSVTKNIRFLISIMFILSSCVVSSKLYDEQVAKNNALLEQIESNKSIYEYKDELCRTVAYELQLQLDTCRAKKDTIK